MYLNFFPCRIFFFMYKVLLNVNFHDLSPQQSLFVICHSTFAVSVYQSTFYFLILAFPSLTIYISKRVLVAYECGAILVFHPGVQHGTTLGYAMLGYTIATFPQNYNLIKRDLKPYLRQQTSVQVTGSQSSRNTNLLVLLAVSLHTLHFNIQRMSITKLGKLCPYES